MLKTTVKLKNLVAALTQLGFEEKRRNGGHAVFVHTKTGAIISLPMVEDNVRVVIFRAILSQIVGLGMATEKRFLQLLNS